MGVAEWMPFGKGVFGCHEKAQWDDKELAVRQPQRTKGGREEPLRKSRAAAGGGCEINAVDCPEMAAVRLPGPRTVCYAGCRRGMRE